MSGIWNAGYGPNGTGRRRYDDDTQTFFQAQQTAALSDLNSKDTSAYEAVVDRVRERIRQASLLTSAQMEDPSPDDIQAVQRLALESIENYNQTAPTQGLPLLDGEPQALAGRVVDEILGWGPLA
ncbi:MAG: hypothetical protein PVF45_13605, partial [Anaerolineae bacterium]